MREKGVRELMSTLQIELSNAERKALDDLARQKGTTAESLAKEAVSELTKQVPENEHQKFLAWREALLGIEGMWTDRTDLPDFEVLRKSWDRDPWNP